MIMINGIKATRDDLIALKRNLEKGKRPNQESNAFTGQAPH